MEIKTSAPRAIDRDLAPGTWLTGWIFNVGDIPIVHRVMKVHEKATGAVELLTKGDNNRVDDRGLYAPGQLWLERDDVLGRAVGTLRYVGMVTIILNDYPALKYVLVSIMGLFVLTNKEEA